MSYSIPQIQQITDGQLLNKTAIPANIVHLLLDSRQILYPRTALFFALPGKHHNGHKYLADLYEKGVRNFIVSEKIIAQKFPEANFIKVANSLTALQKLATFHRNQFILNTIGITGSNGKTIIKEWLFQLLRGHFPLIRSPKSYNSQTGVPLSVWQIKAEHQLGIFEAGISEMGEMEKLQSIIQPNIGIFTNIGPAHSEGFTSIEEKIKQKTLLFKDAQTIIYCTDDERVRKIMRRYKKQKHFTWSYNKRSDLKIKSIEHQQDGGSIINGLFKKEAVQIKIPFSDEAYIENAIHCWATLLFLDIPQNDIRNNMALLEPVAMRLELKDGVNNCTIVNDSYNSDLGSLQIALHFLEQQGNQNRRTLILSDILQSGQPLQSLYKEVAELIVEKKINRFVGVGSAIKSVAEWLPKTFDKSFYPDTNHFLQTVELDQFQNESILIKGARQYEFEKIAHFLSQKVHKTVLEINLSALTHNLHVYSQHLQAGTRMMVMVKASAYGSGSYEVAKLLEFNQVDYLAVAYTDEGVSLRKAGIQLPIMVLNPDEQSFGMIVRHRLEPEIYSLGLLKKLIRFLSPTTTVDIHLKMDTGMKRLGFTADDMGPLLQLLLAYPQIKVKSVFSHLAGSESAQHDDFSNHQIQLFEKHYQQLTSSLSYQPLRHILNSSGIIRFPEYQMDMVRLGMGMYGIDSADEIQDQLQVVHRLKATISQIKTVATNETIGYSRKGVATKPMRIATISIGYADGLLRQAGNGNYQVAIGNHLVPIVGNVCMDMCMIDITGHNEIKEGDEVVIFGEKPNVRKLAQSLGTIPYEIFTNISERVKRVYFQE